jgi:hypothetical protein
MENARVRRPALIRDAAKPTNYSFIARFQISIFSPCHRVCFAKVDQKAIMLMRMMFFSVLLTLSFSVRSVTPDR